MEKIDPEYKIKGYYYGKQLVPVSKILEESLKYPTEKCLKILGFVPKEKIPRNYFIGQIDMVSCVNQFDSNQQKFNALIDGMVELSKVALVRYVTRNNAPPRLAALIPSFQ
jgi:ATP-dependent DNA helicase 2 subunit 2